MKKIFLTSGVLMCMACPTIAEAATGNGFTKTSVNKTGSGTSATFSANTANNGTTLTNYADYSGKDVTKACVVEMVGVTSNTANLKARWSPKWHTLTLSPNIGQGANAGGKDGTTVDASTYYTIEGDTKVYKTRTQLSDGTYSFSNPVSSGSALVTTNPTGRSVNYVLDLNVANINAQQGTKTYATSDFSASGNSAGSSTAATRTLKGFYNSASGGTQTVGSDKNLKDGGATAARDATANSTWYAQWNSATPTISNPVLTGYDFKGWASSTANCTASTPVYITNFATTADSTTIYACWKAHNSKITLNPTSGSGGTTALYARYDVGSFLTEANRTSYVKGTETNVMTGSANAITKPTGATVTITYDVSTRPTNPSTGNKYDVTIKSGGTANATTTGSAARTFAGYYSASTSQTGLEACSSGQTNGSGTQYITASAYLTTTASTGGVAKSKTLTADATWYAKWSATAQKLLTPYTTLTGYTFDGWYKESTLKNKAGAAAANYSPYCNTTLYGKWVANKYNVTYNKGNGNGTTWTHSSGATYDAAYSLPTSNSSYTAARPAKTGYTFIGWTTDSTPTYDSNGNLNNKWEGETYWKRTSALTVYAAYQANQITVTYGCGTQPGSQAQSGTVPSAKTATYDATFTHAANTCAYKGWTFNGWSCSAKLSSNDSSTTYSAGATTGTVTATTAITCTATWKANDIKLNWNTNNGSPETIEQGTCTYEGSVTLPSNPTRLGYTFNGWEVASN